MGAGPNVDLERQTGETLYTYLARLDSEKAANGKKIDELEQSIDLKRGELVSHEQRRAEILSIMTNTVEKIGNLLEEVL